jgi:hypothetical protein
MTATDWSGYLYPALLASTLAVATTLWLKEHDEKQIATSQLATYQSRDQQVERLAEGPAADILGALETLGPLQRAGLLRLQDEKILAHLSQRVDEALQHSRRSNLPNIQAALATLAEARTIYPRDGELIRRHEQLRQRSRSLQTAISEDIQTRLSQGDYRNFGSVQELTRLAKDLRFLDTRLPEPSPTATTLFEEQLQTALAADDGAALARLLGVAELFFGTQPALVDALAQARSLEGAIETLGEYHRAREQGKTATFPRAAAERFYANRFESWRQGMASAENGSDLDLIYQDLARQHQSIPADFPPLVSLKRGLADAYVKQADALLTQDKTREAQPLLQRATELMRRGSPALSATEASL